jgi:HPr kinase/phosphorylase
LLTGTDIPCLIITRGFDLPDSWLEVAEERQLPILRTTQPSTRFIGMLTDFLERRLAPSITIHGNSVDVHGVGMLITGESGIGKSETALELIKRGHRLIADDAVEVTRIGEHILVAQAPEMIKHLMEIRGLGILDIRTLFGAGAIRRDMKISMVIRLEEWQSGKYYDRLGLEEENSEILGVSLPKITIPVRPGRNLAGILEVAAMNYRLKGLGYNSAQEFVSYHSSLTGSSGEN